MFTLSVCMIVKNEESVLERLLNCVKQFADEIIVVDTGSTDNTVQIAKNFTNKVFDYEWQNDFSKARNFSFSLATCDYVMWLDADDYITQENINLINQLKLQKTNADVFMCMYAMGFNEKQEPSLCYYRERILKRSKNFKWQGFIHEVIAPSGKIEYKNIQIQHRKESVKDQNRNLRIYQHAIKNGHILNARETYYYARELYYHKRYYSCIKQLKKYLKMPNLFQPDVRGAYLIMAECYLCKNKPQQALNIFLNCVKNYELTPEICCMMGAIYNSLKQYNLSKFWFKSAITCDPQTQGFVRPEFANIIPYLELTKVYYFIGDIQKSYYYHKLCVQTQPENSSVKHNIKFFNNLKQEGKL